MPVASYRRVLLTLVALAAPAAVSAQPRSADLRALLQEGQTAYQQEHYRRAQELFARVFAETGNAELLYNLALCHRGMGEPADAARYLRRFLVARPTHPDRTSIERTLAEMEASAAELNRVPGQGASTPPSASATGAPPPPRLERDTGLDGPATRVPVPVVPATPRPTPWVRWTLLGVGVVGVGAGLGMVLSARGHVSDAPSAANEQDYNDALSSASTLRGVGAVVLGVGAVAVGAGIVHWLVASPSPERPASRPSVAFGVGPGALVVSGRW